jgi:hypothetical protein
MKLLQTSKKLTISLSLIATLALGANASETNVNASYAGKAERIKQMEKDAPSNPLKNAYFGETHLHTSFSLDAYIGGNRMLPSDSYRFAKGEEMMMNGSKNKLHRPLDFAAVTDHAEYIGEMYANQFVQAEGHDQEELKTLRSLTKFEDQIKWFVKYVVMNNRGAVPKHTPFFPGEESVKSAWTLNAEAAQKHYEPGKFTTFAAFEWSAAPQGGNLHRNVIFRDMVIPELPVSYTDINREEGLWEWMAQQEKKGSTLLAIPHNSNASKGMMFNPNDSKGNPITSEYAQLRNHFERLIEMMQTKGNSEVHRKFWPADEFSDFENADSMSKFSKREFEKRNFVRAAIIEGMKYTQTLGTNPYKYGFVGGTDNHNGATGDVAEDKFIGSHGAADGTAEMRRKGQVPEWLDAKDQSIGALTGVWAEKNTRGAIWDAMYNKETYVTSGPRIQVRLFAGENLMQNPKDVNEMAKDGYANGVPMGGTVVGAKNPPVINVWAIKDSEEANLDRIQVIKGWVDKEGKQHEKIINVAWSDNRKLGADGKLPPVGNTVDLKTAKFTNDIGAVDLMGTFVDSEFDATLPTLYYARVIDIPTPRWTTYDAVRNNLPLLEDVPSTIQERAWSSPIWFMPKKENEI